MILKGLKLELTVISPSHKNTVIEDSVSSTFMIFDLDFPPL